MANEEVMTGGDEPLTAEEAARVLDALDEGDTGALDDGAQEGSEAPDAAADDADGGATADAPAEGEADAEPDGEGVAGAAEGDGTGAVVLARDGKHTIPYEKLQQARQGWQQASAQVQALQQQLEALKAAKQEPEGASEDEASPTEGDGGAGIFGDFSEEALAKGIERLVAERVAQAVQPLAAREAQQARAAHLDAIHARHPHAESIVQSREFAAWVQTHPKRMQAAIWGTFDEASGGNAEEIVEVLDAYTKATGAKTSPPSGPSAAKAAAKSAIARTEAAPPSSLSSIPGGRVDGRDLFARMDDMTGEELYAATENLSPEQMEQWLARAI